MASAVPAHPVQLNGEDQLLDPETRRYAEFYAQILRLRDDVLAGRHPRLRLPDHALEKTASQPSQTRPSPTSRPATNGTVNGTAPHPYPYTSQGSSPYISTPTQAFARPASSQRPPALKQSSSGIDPVLLTKSDDLVRAEIQLKRQRIERILKDQVDQKRVQSRDRDFGVDAESRFDVSDILARALAIVKPVSGLRSETNGNSPTSESFDENSYYSSQANSWSSDDHDTSGVASGVDGAGTSASHLKSGGDAAPLNGNADVVAQENGLPISQREMNDDMDLVEEGEESDYEPPAADAFAIMPPPESHTPHGRNPGANGPLQSHFNTSHGSLPSPTVPVITNHIQIPVAPQPARVSPLTFAKVPGLDTSRGPGAHQAAASAQSSPRNATRGKGNASRNDDSPRNSGRQSPAASRQQNNARKRRKEAKEAERADKQRRVSNKGVPDSPEPYIKEEPVSPPPFASFAEPAQDARRRTVRPLHDDVEIISPREAHRPVYYMDYEPSAPVSRYDVDAAEVVRVPSRVAYRRVERDDQDLRRVASLQYARRPYSPPQPSPYGSVRAVSHAYLDDAPAAASIYREGSVRPGTTRYIRSDRSLSPPYAMDPYQRTRSPAMMAPPPIPRRVVVDQYGNRYYAEPSVAERRTPIALAARRVGEEVLYERARTREPTTRPVARAVEAHDDDEALQRMPPPQPRRYIEQPELEVVEPHRAYRQRDYSMRPTDGMAPREELVAAPEPLERRPVARYEEMPPPPRDYITRSFSVRPEAVRRDMAAEYVSRHGSVAPGSGYARRAEPVHGYREVSVVHGGEGVPFEERRYAYAPQHAARRYVDEQEVVERAAEGPEQYGEARNVTYRY